MSQKSLTLPIPFCLFKFLDFPFNPPSDFKTEWRNNKASLITSEPLKLNIELIRNYEDMLKIFPNAIFLNKNPNDAITKWGVWSVLLGRLVFLVKLVFFEKYVIVLQISAKENNGIVRRIMEEILAGLEFVLCE